MDEKKVLASVADTLVEKPVTLKVDILHPSSYEKLLFKIRKKELARTFHVKPLSLASMVKVSKLFLGFDMSSLDKENLLTGNYKLIVEHARSMARAIAISVVNNKDDPPESLVEFFYNNLSAAELSKVVAIIIKQCRVQDFMISIISISGINILASRTASARSASLNGVNPLEQMS